MSDYGDNISRISDLIKQSNETPLESIDENESNLFSQAVGKAQKKQTEYTDKWDTIKEKGDEELAGVLGIEVPLKGYKKAKSLYKKYKDAKEQLEKKQKPEDADKEEDPDGVEKPEETEAPEVDEGGGASGSSYSQEAEDRILNRIPNEPLPDSSTATMSNPATDEPLLAEGERSGANALESDATSFGERVGKIGSDALDTLKSGLVQQQKILVKL